MRLNRKIRNETNKVRHADGTEHHQHAGLYSLAIDPVDQEDCNRLKR